MQKFLSQAEVVTCLMIKALLKCDSGEEDKTDKRQIFYYSMLIKTLYSFEGCLYLSSFFKIRPFFRITFMSAIRDIVSDLVTMIFIDLKGAEEGVDIQEELRIIYKDHYVSMDKTMPLIEKMFGQDERFEDMERDFFEYGSDIRKENGKIKGSFSPRSKSIFNRIEYIFDKGPRELRDVTRMLFIYYYFFSKSAHFGEKTIEVISYKFVKSKSGDPLFNLGKMIKIILLPCFTILDEVLSDEETDNSKIQEELDKLMEMKVDF